MTAVIEPWGSRGDERGPYVKVRLLDIGEPLDGKHDTRNNLYDLQLTIAGRREREDACSEAERQEWLDLRWPLLAGRAIGGAL